MGSFTDWAVLDGRQGDKGRPFVLLVVTGVPDGIEAGVLRELLRRPPSNLRLEEATEGHTQYVREPDWPNGVETARNGGAVYTWQELVGNADDAHRLTLRIDRPLYLQVHAAAEAGRETVNAFCGRALEEAVARSQSFRERARLELEHIPRGSVHQNLFRAVYFNTRLHELSKDPYVSCSATLNHALELYRESNPVFMPDYEKSFFFENQA